MKKSIRQNVSNLLFLLPLQQSSAVSNSSLSSMLSTDEDFKSLLSNKSCKELNNNNCVNNSNSNGNKCQNSDKNTNDGMEDGEFI